MNSLWTLVYKEHHNSSKIYHFTFFFFGIQEWFKLYFMDQYKSSLF